MKSIIIEANTIEEARAQAAIELKTKESEIDFAEMESENGVKVQATVKVNYPIKGLQYLKSILEGLGIKAVVEMRKRTTAESKEIRYVITSDENPILIGKGGKTLEAIQILIRYIVNGDIDDKDAQFNVSVDCGGYKESRNKHLEILATKTAKEVASSGVEAHLEPMNSYERRIIHAKLAEWKDVCTESEGQGKDRHIVIKPKNRD